MITIDMRNVKCPMPVIETKRMLDNNIDETICTIVDNKIAVENILKMINDINCTYEIKSVNDNLHYIYTTKSNIINTNTSTLEGVLVINSEFMGENKEIGTNLMTSCIHILADLDKIPKTIILYNSAVKLFNNNQVFNDFKNLENLGVEILSCGACIEFFNIKSHVGTVTNIYEVMQTITKNHVTYIGG